MHGGSEVVTRVAGLLGLGTAVAAASFLGAAYLGGDPLDVGFAAVFATQSVLALALRRAAEGRSPEALGDDLLSSPLAVASWMGMVGLAAVVAGWAAWRALLVAPGAGVALGAVAATLAALAAGTPWLARWWLGRPS